MTSPLVRNYRRPASLGGPSALDVNEVNLRWFGTANFELTFGDRVLLLDNYYDRSPRDRSLGFTAADVSRADLILIGHPHADHIGDTVQVARQTGARTLLAPIGVDYLLENGISAERIVSVPGLGEGDLVDEGDYTVRALHGFHLDIGLSPEQTQKWETLRAAQADFAAEFIPPITPEEHAAGRAFLDRGVHTPEVGTEATLSYIIDIDGFRIAYRDSGGAISAEERAYFASNPGVDVAILSINGLPHVAHQLEEIFLPLVQLYQPKVLVPAHHDELWVNSGNGLAKVFNDVATVPLKDRVHDELPNIVTVQPGLLEPVSFDRSNGAVNLGEVTLR